MSPRTRIFLLTLLTALVIAPAQASAASTLAAPSCISEAELTYALPDVDTTSTTTAWQSGAAGTVSVNYAGTGGAAWQWSTDCGTTIHDAATTDAATISGDGPHKFSHRAKNAAGEWTHWVDQDVQIDSKDPVVTTAPPSGWIRGPLSIDVTGSDTSPIVLKEWRVDSLGPFTAGAVATVLATTGDHTLYTAVTDSVGRRAEINQTVQIDNTAPVDGTTVPSGWQHQITDVTIQGSDAHAGIDHVEWELDGSAGAAPGPKVLHIGHGDHVLKTKVVDKAGNESPLVTRSVQVDINGPLDTTTVPSGWVTTGDEVPVNVSGNDTSGRGVVRVEWKLTNTATKAMRSDDVAGAGPVPIVVSGDGVHKLETRLTDGMGDDSGWRTQYVRIDTITPTDTTDPVSGWVNQAAVNVTVGGTDVHSDIEHVEWNLNGTPGSAVGRSSVVAVNREGINTLKTLVVDNAGNRTAETIHTIRLDTTPPLLKLTPAPDSTWQTEEYTVKLDAPQDGGAPVNVIRWQVDNGNVLEGNPGTEIKFSTTGVYTLNTWAVDAVGNISADRPETVRVDVDAPSDTTVCSSAPIAVGHKIPVTVTDVGSGPAGVHWKVDGLEKSGSSAVIPAGKHLLETSVEDIAGNRTDWRRCTVTGDPSLPPEDVDAPLDRTTTLPKTWQTRALNVTVSADDNGGTGVDYVEWRLEGRAIESGPSGSTFTITEDGVHEIETRATDFAGNVSEWQLQQLNIDGTLPVDTTKLASGWTKTRTFTLTATDATSDVKEIEYKINGGSSVKVPSGTDVTLPADGPYTIARRVTDFAGQQTGWTTVSINVDTVSAVNTSPDAPTTWQTAALSVNLTGTDVGSGVDHAEWRIGTSADPTVGSPAVVGADGVQTLQTRVVDKAGNVSLWRSETVRVDRTAPSNTTPAVTDGWRKTNFSTTVSGTDATSGVQKVEWRLDGGSISSAATVSVTADGAHKLETRVVDVAGNVGDWRVDNFGVDQVVPSLAVDCGTTGWRNTQAACSVAASGGLSGLASVTANGTTVVGGSYAVPAEGATTISFRAVDGAGNETTASADVKVDTTLPTPAVTCANGAGAKYVCTASATDAVSGVASLAWSVDGSVPVSIANGGTFSVAKGSVVVYASDNAGNGAASSPVALVDRSAPAPTPTPRTGSEAVLLRKGGAPNARLVGQLAISSLPTSTTVDLRPLAIGKGSFQFVFKIKSGKKSKTVTKTQTVKTGYSTRISVALGASSTTSVALTVRKKSGKRWISYASAAAKL